MLQSSEEELDLLRQLDAAADDFIHHIPAEPYINTSPSEKPYKRSDSQRDEWCRHGVANLFDHSEEPLQYQSFIYHDPIHSLIRQEVPSMAAPNERVKELKASSDAARSPSQGSKKFSLEEYSRRKANKPTSQSGNTSTTPSTPKLDARSSDPSSANKDANEHSMTPGTSKTSANVSASKNTVPASKPKSAPSASKKNSAKASNADRFLPPSLRKSASDHRRSNSTVEEFDEKLDAILPETLSTTLESKVVKKDKYIATSKPQSTSRPEPAPRPKAAETIKASAAKPRASQSPRPAPAAKRPREDEGAEASSKKAKVALKPTSSESSDKDFRRHGEALQAQALELRKRFNDTVNAAEANNAGKTKRKAAAEGLEAMLCYLTALVALDEATAANEIGHYKAVTPFLKQVRAACRDWPLLLGLYFLAAHAYRASMCTRLASETDKKNTEGLTAHVERLETLRKLYNQSQALAGAAWEELRGTSKQEYPDSHKAILTLPRVVTVRIMVVVACGKSILKEWTSKEGVDWKIHFDEGICKGL